MRSATFRNIALGILALAATYHLGARSAGAQAPGNQVVGVGIAATQSLYGVMVTANGDVYTPTSSQGFCQWSLCSNVFAGPTPTTRETFGALKSRYRGAPGATQPATQDR